VNRATPGIRYRVSIEPIEHPHYSHRWFVVDDIARHNQIGFATSRAAAWKLALATLRGMIALARIRKSAA